MNNSKRKKDSESFQDTTQKETMFLKNIQDSKTNQDKIMTEMISGLNQLGTLASDINTTTNTHIEIINNLDQHTDSTIKKVQTANDETTVVTEEIKKDRW